MKSKLLLAGSFLLLVPAVFSQDTSTVTIRPRFALQGFSPHASRPAVGHSVITEIAMSIDVVAFEQCMVLCLAAGPHAHP